MIALTAPSGTVVEVDPERITMMLPNDGTYHEDAKTVLVVDGLRQAVQETVEEIDTLIQG